MKKRKETKTVDKSHLLREAKPKNRYHVLGLARYTLGPNISAGLFYVQENSTGALLRFLNKKEITLREKTSLTLLALKEWLISQILTQVSSLHQCVELVQCTYVCSSFS